MKISLDDKEIYEVTEFDIKILEDDIPTDEVEAEVCKKIEWVLRHKVDRCFDRFLEEWIKRLRLDPDVTDILVDREEFVNLVTARPDYKNRSEREAENEGVMG